MPLRMTSYDFVCMTYVVLLYFTPKRKKSVLNKFQLQQFKQAVKLREMYLSKHHYVTRCLLGFQVTKDVHANFVLF